jgi:hypothetical protein
MTKEYTYKVKRGRTIPYGYKLCEDDPELLEPIPAELDALREALKYLKNGHPYREVATWLSKKTGRSISHVGLRKIALKRKKTLDRRTAPTPETSSPEAGE